MDDSRKRRLPCLALIQTNMMAIAEDWELDELLICDAGVTLVQSWWCVLDTRVNGWVVVRLDLPSCCTQYDTLSTASTVRNVDLKIVLRTFIDNLSSLLDFGSTSECLARAAWASRFSCSTRCFEASWSEKMVSSTGSPAPRSLPSASALAHGTSLTGRQAQTARQGSLAKQ